MIQMELHSVVVDEMIDDACAPVVPNGEGSVTGDRPVLLGVIPVIVE